MSRRTSLVCLASFALFLFTSSAAFAAASARLVYTRGPGAEQCPGEQVVRAAVSTRLGYDPFFGWAHDTLFVEVTRARGVFRVRIEAIDDANRQRGVREVAVKGDDCSTVVDALALTISLTIDPAGVIRGHDPVAPSAAPPTADEAEPSEAPRTPLPEMTETELSPEPSPPETPLRPAIQARVGAALTGLLGSAPAAAAGATILAGLRWRAVSVDLEGRADLPASGDVSGIRVQSSVLAASFVPCAHLGSALGCAVVSAGSLTAGSVEGIALRRSASAPWSAIGPRIGLELPLSAALTLRAYGELLWTATQNWLVVADQPGRIYTFEPWSGGLGIGGTWHRFL